MSKPKVYISVENSCYQISFSYNQAIVDRYLETYKPRKYLFEGQLGGLYSQRSIQNILKKACEKAGKSKHATVHTLRHSSSKTTEIYTHVSNKMIGSIRSPFDDLDI